MDFLMSMLLFDKSALMKKEEQKKRYSYLFVITLVLVTSLIVVITKTLTFDESMFRTNLEQVEHVDKDQVVYQDGLNRVKIEKGNMMLNGDSLFSIEDLTSDSDLLEEIDNMMGVNIQLSFILFIYQYLSSFKYLVLFLVLLPLLSFTSQRQIKLVEDINVRLATTYTSYILIIPIFLSLVIRFLNIRFSFAVLILTTISIVLEYLFVNYYMKEKGIKNEKKMVA